jgi:hypothetical protein
VTAMKQSKLSFTRITADDAHQQHARIALQWSTDHPAAAEVSAEPKRGPGRPPKKRELALEQAAAEQAPSQKPRTGEYTTWFSSPYLLDVLKALRLHHYSAKRTVSTLKRTAPDDRYARLSDSTIRGWFEKGTKQLLPQFQQQLDGIAAPRTGRPSQMSTAVEEECKRVLLKLRDTGVPVNSHVIRWTLQSVFRTHDPSLLESLRLSQQWLSQWVRTKLQWRWRARTTAASKLPMDWEEQGVLMAKRIAAQMEMHEVSSMGAEPLAVFPQSLTVLLLSEQVHPSLVVNMDQTGANLVPAASWTYEMMGSAAVATVGAEDKRQITACLASSLHGDLLPLQLIFQGKTERCLPAATASSKAARVHITCSPNHWSSQQTMQQWITEVLLPYTERCVSTYRLRSDANVILVLDVWAVHKSEEFRLFLRTHHPRIHLVFVPANCTSKLQVADVALQRPFKSALRRSFDQWAAEQLYQQIRQDRIIGLAESFKMKQIKPLVLQWCIDSWLKLQQRKSVIADGWYRCCLALYDVHDPSKRVVALAAVAKRQLDDVFVPEDEEEPDESEVEESDHTSDEERDDLNLELPLPENTRRSGRERKPPPPHPGSYMLNPERIALTEDSEA